MFVLVLIRGCVRLSQLGKRKMEIITSFDKILDTNNRFYVFNCTKADTLFLSVKGTDKRGYWDCCNNSKCHKITELFDTNYVRFACC